MCLAGPIDCSSEINKKIYAFTAGYRNVNPNQCDTELLRSTYLLGTFRDSHQHVNQLISMCLSWAAHTHTHTRAHCISEMHTTILIIWLRSTEHLHLNEQVSRMPHAHTAFSHVHTPTHQHNTHTHTIPCDSATVSARVLTCSCVCDTRT